MNKLFSSAITAVLMSLTYFSQSSYAEDVFDKGVLVLNDDTFDDAIKRYNCLLTNFYKADW